MFSGSGVPAISYEELALEANGLSADVVHDMEVLAPVRSESIAIVLYTSGSTGIPKGWCSDAFLRVTKFHIFIYIP